MKDNLIFFQNPTQGATYYIFVVEFVKKKYLSFMNDLKVFQILQQSEISEYSNNFRSCSNVREGES